MAEEKSVITSKSASKTMSEAESKDTSEIVSEVFTDCDTEVQYLIFNLNDELLAMNIQNIREITEFGAITPVPMMPDSIMGVLNLRGAVVPVIDLSARFEQGKIKRKRRQCIIIVELLVDDHYLTVGVVVDGVNEVLDVDPDMINPPPEFGANIRSDFIAGIARVEDRLIVVLDVNKVFSVQEISELAQVDHGSSTVGVEA